jgi:hypothetical protein
LANEVPLIIDAEPVTSRELLFGAVLASAVRRK